MFECIPNWFMFMYINAYQCVCMYTCIPGCMYCVNVLYVKVCNERAAEYFQDNIEGTSSSYHVTVWNQQLQGVVGDKGHSNT